MYIKFNVKVRVQRGKFNHSRSHRQISGSWQNSQRYFVSDSEVLTQVIKKIKVGVKVVEVCRFGDNLIEVECNKVYNKKPLHKGIAFPVCLSINEIAGHYSPFVEETRSFKEGDLVKIDLGVHIDGFIALVAHTLVVQSDSNAPVTGRQADVILAAYNSVQAALRQLKPGHLNNDVTKTIQKVTTAYQVNPL